MVALKDVFVAGGLPNLTYVDRKHLNLEKNLRAELTEGYKIIAVTGPTKSGKTVLCKKVIREDHAIWIDAGQIEKSDDFWGALLGALEMPTEKIEKEDESFSAGLRSLFTLKAEIASGRSVKFAAPSKKEILTLMRERGFALIVDDFHYLSDVMQTEVVRSLKSEVFAGLQAILIAVPHRAFDAISAEPEMEGRYSHIEIPEWNADDLSRIATTGFDLLGITVPTEAITNFCSEALGSPLLMQRFCGRLCTHYEIAETVRSAIEIKPTKEVLDQIFKSVAKQFGFPTFERLAKGPQSRSRRNPRRLKDGSGSLDIYQAILVSVGRTGPKAKLHYDEIRDAMKGLLKEVDLPQKHEVSNALGQMETIARTKLKGEPVLEWSKDYLYLTNPFLMFYMRWSETADMLLKE